MKEKKKKIFHLEDDIVTRSKDLLLDCLELEKEIKMINEKNNRSCNCSHIWFITKFGSDNSFYEYTCLKCGLKKRELEKMSSSKGEKEHYLDLYHNEKYIKAVYNYLLQVTHNASDEDMARMIESTITFQDQRKDNQDFCKVIGIDPGLARKHKKSWYY